MKNLFALLVSLLAAQAATPLRAAADQFLEYTEVFVRGTYTKPSNNGLSIGDVQIIIPAAALDRFNQAVFLKPKFKWDYTVGLNYRFPDTRTRFFVDYDHFREDASRTDNSILDIGVVPPPGLNLIPVFEYASLLYATQEIRAGFKRLIPFHHRFLVDLGAFLEYDKLNRTMREYINGEHPAEGAPVETSFRETDNIVKAFGPGVGVLIAGIPFKSCKYFGLFGGVATSLLYAKNRFDESNVVTLLNGTQILEYDYNPENSYSILGKFDVNFGIDYRRSIPVSGSKVNTGLTLGMRYVNYINAFKNGNTYFNPFPSTDDFAANTGHAEDFGRFGPYLQLSVGGQKTY